MPQERYGGGGMPTTALYRLDNQEQLTSYVDELHQSAPPKFIQAGVLEDLAGKIDIQPVVDSLPPHISVATLIEVNKLSLFTECATDLYADVFVKSGEEYNQPWLSRFSNNIWRPDEKGHHAPFKILLMQLGVSEDVLDAEIKRIQSLDFPHGGGLTPAHLTQYGMLQEYLTMNWYLEMEKILGEASPEAASMVKLVRQREAAHTTMYRDMTARQIEENPRLLRNVAEATANFELPGNVLQLEQQEHASEWLHLLHGEDMSDIKKDVVRLTHQAMGKDIRMTGKLLVELGLSGESWFKNTTATHAKDAFFKLGAPGAGLLGEAVLVAAGLGEVYETNADNNIPGKIRKAARNYIAQRVSDKFERQFNLTQAPRE